MMDKKPLFSIIIPVYNSAEKLQRALDSVEKQRFRDFEAIVCDDGSTDKIAPVIDNFRKKFNLKYVREENWGGPARPRNNGLKIARGDYIAFLDSDDWWYPDKLEIIKEFTYHYDVIFHDLDIYTAKGKKIFKKVKGRHLKQPVFNDLMINGNALFTSGVAARRNIINQVRGFREENELISVEDFALWLDISRINGNFIYIPRNLGGYWLDENNISKPSEILIRRINAVYDAFKEYLNIEGKKESDFTRNYFLGRIKQKTGLFKEAILSFRRSLRSGNFKFKSRSAYWIIFINLLLIFTKVTRYRKKCIL